MTTPEQIEHDLEEHGIALERRDGPGDGQVTLVCHVRVFNSPDAQEFVEGLVRSWLARMSETD